MQNDKKAATKPQIDLSNCTLLSPYGQNGAESLKFATKVGGTIKPRFTTKIGRVIKPGA